MSCPNSYAATASPIPVYSSDVGCRNTWGNDISDPASLPSNDFSICGVSGTVWLLRKLLGGATLVPYSNNTRGLLKLISMFLPARVPPKISEYEAHSFPISPVTEGRDLGPESQATSHRSS